MDWKDEVSAAWNVTVGDFRARGGVAEVYEGYQPRLERRVALKVILTSGSQGVVERFEREARTIARLEHPNIVPIFNFGFFGHAMVVLMPWYDASLADAIRTRPLSAADGRRLLDDISSALAFAHENGVTHRDVKPSNIMIDARGKFVLADFGIAHVRDETTLTQSGAVPGTPSYLAPEVIQGHPPGPASDFYGLGATVFEAVSGTRVFDASDPISAAYLHVHAEAPELSVPEDPELARVIRRLLSKDPVERLTVSPADQTGPSSAGGVLPARSPNRKKAGVALALLLLASGVVLMWSRAQQDTAAPPIVHPEVLSGRLVDVALPDGVACPRRADWKEVGAPGATARTDRQVAWSVEPRATGEAILTFGKHTIEISDTPPKGEIVAVVPATVPAGRGRLTYVGDDGRRHQYPVVLPPASEWARLRLLQPAIEGGALQDGVHEATARLGSPGGLPAGPGGNTSVLLEWVGSSRLLYVGAVIDEGPSRESLRPASTAIRGTAYVRFCNETQCGLASESAAFDLIDGQDASRAAAVTSPPDAQVLRLVWSAGSGDTDTRLSEVCALAISSLRTSSSN